MPYETIKNICALRNHRHNVIKQQILYAADSANAVFTRCCIAIRQAPSTSNMHVKCYLLAKLEIESLPTSNLFLNIPVLFISKSTEQAR